MDQLASLFNLIVLIVVFAAIGTVFRISGRLGDLLDEVRGLRADLAASRPAGGAGDASGRDDS